MPTYKNERRPKSRPNELAFAPFIFPKDIERIGTHRSKDRVFHFLQRSSHVLFAHFFFNQASSKANSLSSLRFVHQRLKRPPKIFKPTLHSLGRFWLGTLALTTGSLRPIIGGKFPATSIHPILNPFKLLA
jgi:hypothetical protein